MISCFIIVNKHEVKTFYTVEFYKNILFHALIFRILYSEIHSNYDDANVVEFLKIASLNKDNVYVFALFSFIATIVAHLNIYKIIFL